MGKLDQGQFLSTSLWGLTQGLISALPSHAIPDTACVEVSNFYGDEGKLRRRNGWTQAFTTVASGVSVYGVHEHVAMNGTRTVVCMTLNLTTSAVLFYEWNGAAWVNRTGAAVLTGSEVAPFQPTFANFKGVLYFTTGNQGLYQFTPGGNISAVTNGTAGLRPFDQPKIVISWDGRLFCFNTTDASSGGNPVPARAAWCDFLDATVWQGLISGSGSSGYQDLYYGDDASDGITAAIDLRDNLVVFKPYSMYVGAATGDAKYYEFRPVFRDIGCVGQNTLRRLRETLFWVGYDNIYMMEGLQVPTPIGDAILSRFTSIVYTPQLKYANALLDPINKLYHVFVPYSGSGNLLLKMFTYNITENSWWEGTIANSNIQPACSRVIYDNPFAVSLYCGSRDGKIYKFDPAATTDGGTKFTTKWVSKRFDAHKLFNSKAAVAEIGSMHIQSIAPMAESGSVKVQLQYGPSLDLQATSDTRQFDFDGTKSERFLHFREGGRFVQVILTNTDIADAALIEGMTLRITPRGEER